MKQENKGAIVGFLGGAALLASFHFLSTPEIVENHITETDTVWVDNTVEVDSLQTVIEQQSDVIEEQLNKKPQIIYVTKKAPKPTYSVADAADIVFSRITQADSSQ